MMDPGVPVNDAEDRLRRIAVVTDTSLAQLDPDTLLQELLERVHAVLDVDIAEVLLREPEYDQLVAIAAVGIEENLRQGVRLPIDEDFASAIVLQKQPVVLDRLDDTMEVSPVLREKGINSLLGVPMMTGGDVVGVLHAGTCAQRRFSEQDTHLLQVVADRMALAVRASRSGTERMVATTLQRSLLPDQLPTVPGFTFDARYVPGEDSGVGGDWYDVFSLPSGRLGIVIGDVVGNGLPAAVVMGRLRSALRAYALETEDPAEVLTKLDRKATHFEKNAMATVAYAVLDPEIRRLSLSIAGHPAPAYAFSGARTALVDAPVDPPVGLGMGKRERRTHEVELAPGAVLCFFTDGLVERRQSTVDEGIDRLCSTLSLEHAETVCGRLMSRLIGASPVADDVAALVVSMSQANSSGQ